MTDTRYLWIVRWEDFQHYKPSRERGPAWIKQYTAQLDDGRYIALTDRQRALLHDLRCVHAAYRMRTPYVHGVITKARGMRTYSADLKALTQAGFIEVISRETLDLRLAELYSRERSKKKKELSLPPAVAREDDGRQTGEDINWQDRRNPSTLQRRLAEEITRRSEAIHT